MYYYPASTIATICQSSFINPPLPYSFITLEYFKGHSRCQTLILFTVYL